MWVLAHSICLPGEEAASLPTVSSDIELLAQSRSKVIHEKFCLHGSLTEAYLHSLSGTTCEPSESTTQIREATLSGCEKGAGNSSFVAGSRSYAKISALQEMGLELQGNEAGFGLSKQGSFAKWSPSTSIWRTVQHSLFEDLELSLEKWPRWGSMLDGVCYQEPIPERSICANEFGFFLPTPGKSEGKGSSKNRYLNSPHFHGAKTSEGLRTCEADPIYLNPLFGELIMMFPMGWTDLQPLGMRKFQEWRQQHGES